jgi:mono/diheme cytochrome c family protein
MRARHLTCSFTSLGSFVLASAIVALIPMATPSRASGQDRDHAPDGRDLFDTHCASCHDRSGTGGGPAAAAMRRLPPDITGLALANGGVFPVERVRRVVDGRDVESHGNREMPVWGKTFKTSGTGMSEAAVRARIASIIEYLKAIQRARG